MASDAALPRNMRKSIGATRNASCAISCMVATANAHAWERLEAMLAAMHSGDLVTIEQIVCETGVSSVSAQQVLDALAHAELYEQRGAGFIRVQTLRTYQPSADESHSERFRG